METKRCTQCHEAKPVDDFYRGKAECKRCSIERTLRWQAANPERAQAWRENNREKVKTSNRRAHAKKASDPEVRQSARERAKAWREENRERHRTYSRQWQLDNIQRYRLSMRDAMRRRRLGRDEVSIEYSNVLRADPCCYCGAPCEHIDHIVPVVNGGTNHWDNLTAACSSCNSQKRTISMLEFMRRNATPRTAHPN